MSNHSGKAFIYLIIVLLLAAAVASAMYVPQVKDFISAYVPGIYPPTDTSDDSIVKAPVKPVTPENAQAPTTDQVPGTQGQPVVEGETPVPDQTAANPVPATGQNAEIPQPFEGIIPMAGLLQNPFSNPAVPQAGTQKPAAAVNNDGSPGSIVKSCMAKLQNRDIIGAEQYVSENGRKLTLAGMTGIHKILMKNMIDMHSFDEIGYNDAKIHGQTAWVPIYSKLDAKSKIISLYILCANRGDGWKVDDLYDPR